MEIAKVFAVLDGPWKLNVCGVGSEQAFALAGKYLTLLRGLEDCGLVRVWFVQPLTRSTLNLNVPSRKTVSKP